MFHHTPERFAYDLNSITHNAPPMPGVFAVFSPSECIYVGASDDVCASLLEIYYEDQPCLNDKYLSHFSFDLVPAEVRVALQTQRIQELRPVCNLRTASSKCGPCRLAQGIPAGPSRK